MKKPLSINPDPGGIGENESSISGLEITGLDASLIINFILKRNSVVNLSLFDANGCLIATLAKGQYLQGTHSVTWNNNDFSQGVCFILLEAGEHWISKKAVFAK